MAVALAETAGAGDLQALGNLAAEVVSVSDISVPLTAKPVVALLPANVAKFADGLEVAVRAIHRPETAAA